MAGKGSLLEQFVFVNEVNERAKTQSFQILTECVLDFVGLFGIWSI